jgi:hypothetical protein
MALALAIQLSQDRQRGLDSGRLRLDPADQAYACQSQQPYPLDDSHADLSTINCAFSLIGWHWHFASVGTSHGQDTRATRHKCWATSPALPAVFDPL